MPLAWKTNDLKQIVTEIKKHDDTYYLTLVDELKSLEPYEVRDYLEKLTDTSNLSDAQVYNLYAMQYKGGHTFGFYRYGGNRTNGAFETRLNKICGSNRHSYCSQYSGLSADDLKYVSQYYRNQWKKDNGTPGKRMTKGLDANIAMDEFSLIMFKEAITKSFNQTEGKNYIMSVNKAFGNSQDTSHIKIRNKFYKLIIDNTTTHSKAMINQIQSTNLITKTYIKAEDGTNICTKNIYKLDDDEAIALYIGWDDHNLKAYAPAEGQSTYAGDLNIVTGNTNITSTRDQIRYASAASMLLSVFIKTNNLVYKDKAEELLSPISDEIKEQVYTQTQAITTLNSILKQGTENE